MEGKIAVVTGAASGIGRATARALAENGSEGVALVDIHDNVEMTAAEIREVGRDVAVFRCDLGDVSAIRSTFSAIVTRFGRIDACALPGGFSYRAKTLAVTEDEWDMVLNANLRAAFFCNQEALKVMYAQGRGSIVNMSADAAFHPIEGFALQAAGKGGIWHMTQTLALEAQPNGVRVNCVSPGNTAGGGGGLRVARLSWAAPIDREETREKLVAAMPRGAMLEADEVANVIMFLCSDLSTGISGSLVHVNAGGYYTLVF